MIEEKLASLGKKLDNLMAQGSKLSGKAKIEFDKKMHYMREKQNVAARKINELKNSGGDKLRDLKTKMDSLMDDLNKSYKETLFRFKGSEKKVEKEEKKRRKEYQKQVKSRLKEFDKKLDELDRKKKNIENEARIHLDEGIVFLKKKRDEIREKFKELKSSDGKKWDDQKSIMDMLIDDLDKSYNEAIRFFN